jgi:hypothetical protein
MRQFALTWLHWGNVGESSRPILCPDRGPSILLSPVPRPDATHLVPNLDGMFAQAHAGETHCAGIPIDTIITQRSGFRTSTGVTKRAVLVPAECGASLLHADADRRTVIVTCDGNEREHLGTLWLFRPTAVTTSTRKRS